MPRKTTPRDLFSFEVDGTTYTMPKYDPAKFTPHVPTLAEASKLVAQLGDDGFEQRALMRTFGNMQLAVESHLDSDEHAPAALAVAAIIERSADNGYREFFEFFRNWLEASGEEVVDPAGESSGSQVS